MTKMEKIYPEFDVVHSEDAKSELSKLQIRLHGAEKMLGSKRKNLVEVRKSLDIQWKELNEKEKQLRENFIHFDQFITENMEKRERAEKKIKDDKILCEQRRKDIEKCEKDYIALKEAKFEMDKKIKEYKLYENFLDKVVDTSQEFISIQDMINRYMTLLSAKLSLAKLQEQNLVALERAKSDMMKLIEEKNFIIMGLNNQIANLQSRFENAKIKSIDCEHLVLKIKNNAVLQLHEIDEVKSSIWNLYTHMAQSKEHPIKIDKDNVEEQVMYIKRTLTELAKVNQILRKRAKAALKTKSKT
ncbi:coiled-coil domain-containing protein 42 homolog [Diorhabda sublineata]|nr:coiled-coil domain-containing protein 42 homolog [Diorhabda sublineata]